MLSQQAQLAEQLQNIQQGITDGRHPIPEMQSRLKKLVADRLGVEDTLKGLREVLNGDTKITDKKNIDRSKKIKEIRDNFLSKKI